MSILLRKEKECGQLALADGLVMPPAKPLVSRALPADKKADASLRSE